MAVDWVRTERLYRQGEISIREIARRQGVSEGAIRKRAKVLSWEREIANLVRSVVRTQAWDSLSQTPAAQISGARGLGTQAAGASKSESQERKSSGQADCGGNPEDDSETERDYSEAPEWMRLYFMDRAKSEESSVRLSAHIDPTFRDAFRIFTDAGGFLLAIGRQPKLAAATRLLEEGLATSRSKVELVFVDGEATEYFTIGDVVG